jgi:hypothetical protein
MITYHKNPVHEIVSALPTSGISSGYRCILTTDNKIYTYNGGTWTSDDNFNFGSHLSVIGRNGQNNNEAAYINASTYSLRTYPFLAPLNGKIVNAVYYNDNLYFIITASAIPESKLYLVKSNGDSFASSMVSGIFVKAVVDSLGNIWVATAASGLYKFSSNDNTLTPTILTSSNSSLPFDTITDIVVDGNKLWIIYASGTDFKICHYDGYVFTDYTAQIETDLTATGLDCDALTAIKYYDLTVDDDAVYFSFTDATVTGNLFYFNKTDLTFYAKTLSSAFTGKYLTKFIKIDDYIYCLVSAAAAGTNAKLWVWQWSDGTALYTGTTVNLLDLTTDGLNIVLFSATALQTIVYPAYTPVDADAAETAISALLTDSSTLELCDVAISATGRKAYSNTQIVSPNQINCLVEDIPTPQWVETTRH